MLVSVGGNVDYACGEVYACVLDGKWLNVRVLQYVRLIAMKMSVKMADAASDNSTVSSATVI